MSNRNSDRSPSPMPDDEKTRHNEQIIEDLFAGRLTAEAAAAKIAAITVPDPNIDSEDCEEDLQMLWSLVLASLIAEPDRVNTVANLISCISSLPPPMTKLGKQLAVNEGTLRVWDDTPTLGWALRNEWNVDLSGIYGPADRKATIDRFVTTNRLIAKLMADDEKRFDYKSFTLYTFRGALEYTAEEPEPEARGPDNRECYIPAAAQLIQVAGHLIRRWDFEFESGPLVGDRGRGGALWNGKHGFCKERWELWKHRFLEVSTEKELSDETRACAKIASETMSAYDRL